MALKKALHRFRQGQSGFNTAFAHVETGGANPEQRSKGIEAGAEEPSVKILASSPVHSQYKHAFCR